MRRVPIALNLVATALRRRIHDRDTVLTLWPAGGEHL
jgi:hypothetical protein